MEMSLMELSGSILDRLSLSLLLQAKGAEVEETFRWLAMPPPWVVVLVIIPVVALFAAFFYRRESLALGGGRPASESAWRGGLGTLRVIVILMVLAMLAEPVIRRTTYETRDSTILLLVDDSLSMDVADRYSRREIPEKIAALLDTTTETVESTTRYELVRRLLADEDVALLDKLREKGKVVVATIAKTVEEKGEFPRARGESSEIDIAPGEVLPPYDEVRNDTRVQETRIAEGLRDSVSSIVGSAFGDERERISGVLLLSDFQENAGSGSAVEIARRLGERGTPVHTVGVGNPDEPRDVRLVNLDSNDVVLVDDTVPFDVTVIADGFEGERVYVKLAVDSQQVSTEYVILEGGGKRQTVRLQYRPRTAGEFTVTVDIEKLGGEVFYDNNTLSKTIRVLDQKIKVLYAEHLPRWEYRYLKNALTRDPTMETHVWLFSADPEFRQESSPSLPSLQHFPRTRAELFQYHVIILGDVHPDDLGTEAMGLIKDFVFEGGGVIFLAGRNANPSGYLHTDFYPILPVEVAEADRFADDRRVTQSFKVELTPEGEALPVMRLDNDPDRNKYLWENTDSPFFDGLPGFFWHARTPKEKASAVVLARHQREEDSIHRRKHVIFAYMNYGKGRSFFSAVDETWRWRAGVENLFFYRFWGQIVRFVATGRLLGNTPRFSVATDKSVYDIGEVVRVEARVFDADMKPSTEETQTLYHQLQGREGEPPEEIEIALNEIKGPGSYEGVLTASQRGRHDIWLGSESERLAFRSFTVEIPALESRDPRLNRALMRKVAVASGGGYYDLYDVLEAAENVQGVTRSQEGLVENDDLWDEWWILILFTAVISLEWVLRKMVRLQ